MIAQEPADRRHVRVPLLPERHVRGAFEDDLLGPGDGACQFLLQLWRGLVVPPEITRTGTSMRPSRSSADQSLNEPTMWNSDGPFVVWYTVGSESIAAKERFTSSGHGSARHR
jgi:hypothetical protein